MRIVWLVVMLVMAGVYVRMTTRPADDSYKPTIEQQFKELADGMPRREVR